ncbi:MAG: hypothetical protein HY074_17945 [Deltaproteobacteria bacterium]|nr:hypothetical protein [Deltaproteobacteria bacterium]
MFSAWGTLGCLLAAAPVVAADGIGAGYEKLLQTRFTDVDLGASGFTRRYDAQGQLVEMVYVDRRATPAVTEKFEFSHAPETQVHTIYHGKVLVSRSVERYSAPGQLREIEALWSSRDDGVLDRKTRTSYSDLQANITEYRLEGSDWKVISESTESSGHSATATEYTACLSKAGKVTDPAACSKLLDSFPVPQKDLKDFSAVAVENLTCLDGNELFLPNGYRIDTKTCDKRDAQDVIKRAANHAVGAQLSCLAKVNPKLADKMVLTLLARRPLIKCGGTTERVGNSEFCDKPDTGSKCDKEYDHTRAVSSAFFSGKKAENLYLTGGDPMGHAVSGGKDDELKAAVDKAKIQVDERDLAATIFHETLHSCSHHHHKGKDVLAGPDHDATPPSFADAVYGCEALCGPSPEKLTREGCQACATAEGNLPTQAARDKSPTHRDCAKFPDAATVRQLYTVRWVADQMTSCISGKGEAKVSACAALTGMTQFAAICGKDGKITDESCQTKLNIWAAKQVVAAARSKGAALAFKYTADSFSKAPPYEVVDGGIRVPAQVTMKIPGLENYSARRFANAIILGFCESVRAKFPDFKMTTGDLNKIGAEYGYGLFPDNPEELYIRSVNSGQWAKGGYPLGEMIFDSKFMKENKVNPSQPISSPDCPRYLDLRKNGYYP